MHTQETIVALLERSDAAVKRAIKALAPAGFDGPDGAFLADIFAKLPRYDDRMTPPQYRRARRALPAYAGRLLAIANGGMGECSQSPMPEVVSRDPGERCPPIEWGSW